MRRILVAQKTSPISHGIAVSTLFSAIALLYGSAAYGGFYPGHIDPGGNGTVPAFTGDAVFNIPSACFANDGTNFTFNGSGGCGAATVYSALIDLYTTNPAVPPAPPNDVVVGQFSLTPIDFWPISEIFVVNGGLAGVETGIMGSDPGTGGWAGRDFWLDFDCNECLDPPTAFIYIDDPGIAGNKSLPGIVTFGPECRTDPNGAPVDCVVPAPEPGTLALLFGALGGGWLARRRKAKLKA
jgi:hypothetical protein